MIVLVDRDGLAAFTGDALAATARARDDLDEAREALAAMDHPDATGTVTARGVAAVLADVADLLGEFAGLAARPAHVAAMFARLDDTLAGDRHLAAWLERSHRRPGPARDRHLVESLVLLAPRAVAALWASLPRDHRDRLATHHGDRLSGLAGMPLEVRDRLNRARLRAHLRDLGDDLVAHPHGPGGLPGDTAWITDPGRTALAARIRRLESLLDADRILAFDPHGDGRAVVAFGDPATARHVATIVPGIGTTLDAMPRLVREARVLRDAAREVDDDVTTIAWLGHDSPPGLIGIGLGILANDPWNLALAATDASAEAQQQALVDHAGGLRAHNAGMHHTVVGHSYGAVLAFRALAPGGSSAVLDADDVVALGAPGPGSGITTLGDLDLRPGVHVWSADSPFDPVPRLPGVLGPSIPSLGDEVGRLPTDRSNAGHGRYFVPGSATVGALAAVVAGRPTRAPSRLSEVAPRHGRRRAEPAR